MLDIFQKSPSISLNILNMISYINMNTHMPNISLLSKKSNSIQWNWSSNEKKNWISEVDCTKLFL